MILPVIPACPQCCLSGYTIPQILKPTMLRSAPSTLTCRQLLHFFLFQDAPPLLSLILLCFEGNKCYFITHFLCSRCVMVPERHRCRRAGHEQYEVRHCSCGLKAKENALQTGWFTPPVIPLNPHL